jgi:hypothetical protein
MSEPANEATSSLPQEPVAGRRRRWLFAAALLGLAVALAALWIDSSRTQRELRLDVAKRLGEIEVGEQTSRPRERDPGESARSAGEDRAA